MEYLFNFNGKIKIEADNSTQAYDAFNKRLSAFGIYDIMVYNIKDNHKNTINIYSTDLLNKLLKKYDSLSEICDMLRRNKVAFYAGDKCLLKTTFLPAVIHHKGLDEKDNYIKLLIVIDEDNSTAGKIFNKVKLIGPDFEHPYTEDVVASSPLVLENSIVNWNLITPNMTHEV